MLGFAHARVLKGDLNFVYDINTEQSRTKFASSLEINILLIVTLMMQESSTYCDIFVIQVW